MVNYVARLVSSAEHIAAFQNLLGDADIDRFTHTEHIISNHAALTPKKLWSELGHVYSSVASAFLLIAL